MNTTNLTFEQGVMVGAGGVAAFLFALLVLKPWFRAFFSGARISIWYALGMRLRFSPVDLLLDAYLELAKGGFTIPIAHVEAIFMKYKSKIRTPHDLAELCQTIHENMNKQDGQQSHAGATSETAPSAAPESSDA